MRRLLVLPLLLALGGTVTACGSEGSGAQEDPSGAAPTSLRASDLEGNSFSADTVTGYALVKASTVELTFEDGRMVARAGCNTMSGDYTVAEGTLAWTGAPMTTMIGCPDDLAAQDQWLTTLLGEGVAAVLADDVLTLSTSTVSMELAAKQPGVLADVLGRTWTPQTVIDGDAASSVPAKKTPNVTVQADGTAAVFTGCNRGGTKVSVVGETLEFEPMGLTRMMCEPDRAALEAAVVAVLEGRVDATTWDGELLTLQKGEHGLVFEVE